MSAFLFSLGLVVLAEMGDKTQLLAMAFATRYRFSVVMWAVLAATVVNHFLAVLAGNYLTHLVPIRFVQIVAAGSFILFGLWTIRGDELQGEDQRFHFSPFWTVAIAFFIAEMGDKTQLATVSLAAQYQSIFPVLIGTTGGMLIADAIGIVIGIVLGKNVPERFVKWLAALIFIFFGLYGLHENLPKPYLSWPVITGALTFTFLLVILVGRNDLVRALKKSNKA
jgi:putative Ca2+/H+ antiporter (TMEM165/GDT1 family)